MGTTLAVGGDAGLLDEQGNMPQINRPFLVDAGMFLLMFVLTPVALMIPKQATAPASPEGCCVTWRSNLLPARGRGVPGLYLLAIPLLYYFATLVK
ncbi:hypothetical protein SODG_006684 [Sodalis praecaptivus]